MLGLKLFLLGLKHGNHIETNLDLLLFAEFDLSRGGFLCSELLLSRFFLRTDHAIESSRRICHDFPTHKIRELALMCVIKVLFGFLKFQEPVSLLLAAVVHCLIALLGLIENFFVLHQLRNVFHCIRLDGDTTDF